MRGKRCICTICVDKWEDPHEHKWEDLLAGHVQRQYLADAQSFRHALPQTVRNFVLIRIEGAIVTANCPSLYWCKMGSIWQ